MKNVILIAPPAAGKGTQAEILVNDFGYEHISMGDLLREVMASGSALGQEIKTLIDAGKLVDDELTFPLIKNKLQTIEGKPFISDGFPRTLNQAQHFETILKELNITDYVVILLNLSEEAALKRISGRLICSCGKSYNIYNDNLKPKQEGICDKCGQALVKRDDDNLASFQQRYEIFQTNIEPILDFYRQRNKLQIVDVDRSVAEIAGSIKEIITHD